MHDRYVMGWPRVGYVVLAVTLGCSTRGPEQHSQMGQWNLGTDAEFDAGYDQPTPSVEVDAGTADAPQVPPEFPAPPTEPQPDETTTPVTPPPDEEVPEELDGWIPPFCRCLVDAETRRAGADLCNDTPDRMCSASYCEVQYKDHRGNWLPEVHRQVCGLTDEPFDPIPPAPTGVCACSYFPGAPDIPGYPEGFPAEKLLMDFCQAQIEEDSCKEYLEGCLVELADGVTQEWRPCGWGLPPIVPDKDLEDHQECGCPLPLRNEFGVLLPLDRNDCALAQKERQCMQGACSRTRWFGHEEMPCQIWTKGSAPPL